MIPASLDGLQKAVAMFKTSKWDESSNLCPISLSSKQSNGTLPFRKLLVRLYKIQQACLGQLDFAWWQFGLGTKGFEGHRWDPRHFTLRMKKKNIFFFWLQKQFYNLQLADLDMDSKGFAQKGTELH